MKNIVLTGFMGSGKTTVGRIISNASGRDFYDTDNEIIKIANMEIRRIFEKFGEQYFRELEKNIVERLSAKTDAVIATGGGIVKDTGNMAMLAENGVIIYLKCSPEKIYANTSGNNKRPLLNVNDRFAAIKEMLEQRKPLYEACCRFTVDVSDISAEAAAQIILGKVIEK